MYTMAFSRLSIRPKNQSIRSFSAVTAAMVKELRERSSAPMMDCKKALTEVDGDISKAIDWLRAKGIAKASQV